MPAPNIHNRRPGHASKDRVCVIGDLCACFGRDKRGERVHIRLNSDFGEREHHARENVNDDLEKV